MLSLLTNNLIFTYALGTSTVIAAAKSKSSLLTLGLVMLGICTLSSCLLGFLLTLFPRILSESLWVPLVLVSIISVLYLLLLLLTAMIARKRFSQIKKYIHLCACNCAVMGTLYLVFTDLPEWSGDTLVLTFWGKYLTVSSYIGWGFWQGLELGLGFVLASLALLPVRSRLYGTATPKSFQGFPAVMVYFGILSMGLYAL